MTTKTELEELRRIRALQRQEHDQQRLEEIKKENEKKKREEFLSKARVFEQKKGPTDEEKKLIIQKAAAKRKFEKQLQKNIKLHENSSNMNPMAIEFQLRQNGNIQRDEKTSDILSNWELVQQVGGPSYYWNRITNETTYELPKDEQIQSSATRESNEEQIAVNDPIEAEITSIENDQGWLSCQYENGSIYYWNYLTNETVSTLPNHLDPNTIPPYVPQTVEEAPVEKELSAEEKLDAESNRENWMTEWDEYYQAHYYRNRVTETLQWEPPACFSTTSQSDETVTVDISAPAADETTPPVDQEANDQTSISLTNDQTEAVEILETRAEAESTTSVDIGIETDISSILPEVQISETSFVTPSPPPPPPPPPRIPKVEFSTPTNADSNPVNSQRADPISSVVNSNSSKDPETNPPPLIVETPPITSENVSSTSQPDPPPNQPDIVAPTISPLIGESSLDHKNRQEEEKQEEEIVPELELDDKHELQGHHDDDMLVGDGSKPVGCTSCQIS